MNRTMDMIDVGFLSLSATRGMKRDSLEHRARLAVARTVIYEALELCVHHDDGHAAHLALGLHCDEEHLERIVTRFQRAEQSDYSVGGEPAVRFLYRPCYRRYHNAEGDDFSVLILDRAYVVEIYERDIIVDSLLYHRIGEGYCAVEHG